MSREHSLLPQLTSLAFHEMVTPLSVVSGYLRMLLREQGGPLTEKQRKMLEESNRSCARLSALLKELSDFGKLEAREIALENRELDLAALLVELASSVHEGEDRGVRLELRGVDRPVTIAGDRPRLAAALTTMMHAALRERGDPGVIVVECSVRADGSTGWAVVAIGAEPLVGPLADAARGTPPPLDRAREWRGGMGIALPIARRVIEAHGGALWSADVAQPGAASALRLPLRT